MLKLTEHPTIGDKRINHSDNPKNCKQKIFSNFGNQKSWVIVFYRLAVFIKPTKLG